MNKIDHWNICYCILTCVYYSVKKCIIIKNFMYKRNCCGKMTKIKTSTIFLNICKFIFLKVTFHVLWQFQLKTILRKIIELFCTLPSLSYPYLAEILKLHYSAKLMINSDFLRLFILFFLLVSKYEKIYWLKQ